MKGIIKRLLRPFSISRTEGLPEQIANHSKREFIRRISHDIQGNFFGVTSVCAMLKIAVEEKEDTTILFDHLMNACNTYKYELNNFLEYSRREAGLHNALYEAIDIRSLMNRVMNENLHSAFEKKATIRLSVSDEMPKQIIGDETRIAQISANLLINAIRSAHTGGQIMVQVNKTPENHWMLIVEDQSEVISVEKLDTVFQLAFSEDQDKNIPEGLNLGLFVTKHLVEEVLKGKITMFSQTGVGTRCTVILPLR